MREKATKQVGSVTWALLLAIAICLWLGVSESVASPVSAEPGRNAEAVADETPSVTAAHLDRLVRGNRLEAGQALVALAETPDRALRCRDDLLAAVERCSGEIDLAVVPVGPDWFYPEWTRAEVILIWLADSVRKAEPGAQRDQAQAYLQDYCRKIIERKSGPVSPARAFECAVRCLFYCPLVLIEPNAGVDDFLPVLDAAIDREAAAAVNEEEPGSVYYSGDRGLDRILERYVSSIGWCIPAKEKEFLWITSERHDATIWRGDPLLTDPTPEEVVFEFRWKDEQELSQLATKPTVRVSYEGGIAYRRRSFSYRRAIGYVLSETRRKQAKHIETILKLSDRDAFSLGRIVKPVFDVSLDYEKVIVDHLLDFLEAKIKDPSKLAPKPPKWNLGPITESWRAARYLGALGDPASRAPHRSDIYQRWRIAEILAAALSDEDIKVRIEAAKALCKVVVLDAQCAEIALDPMERELETIEAEEVARAGEFDQYRLNGDTANLYGHLKEALAAAGNMRPSPEAHTQ